MPKNETPTTASPETAAAVEAGAGDVTLDGGKHPAVAGFAAPRSSTGDGPVGPGKPVPSIVETATPGIARAQADLEAERLDPDGAAVTQNARERALAGHRAPDTVDLPEARIRVEDNEAALRGLGGVPRD